MRRSKSLIVIVSALALPSCTAYLDENHHARRYAAEEQRPPCESARHAEPARHGHHRGGIIGIAITRAEESHHSPIVVSRVVVDSPADDAEVRPGDRIRAIDGESTRGMTLAEAAHLIRGRADTAVELRIDSPQGSRLVTLVRVAPYGRHGHRCRDGRCRDGRKCHRRIEAPPAEEAAPPTDESFAPEVWPPTKPGNVM